MLSTINLSVVMLTIIMPSVIMLRVVILNVVVPTKNAEWTVMPRDIWCPDVQSNNGKTNGIQSKRQEISCLFLPPSSSMFPSHVLKLLFSKKISKLTICQQLQNPNKNMLKFGILRILVFYVNLKSD
jgi:hypothetical protein